MKLVYRLLRKTAEILHKSSELELGDERQDVNSESGCDDGLIHGVYSNLVAHVWTTELNQRCLQPWWFVTVQILGKLGPHWRRSQEKW